MKKPTSYNFSSTLYRLGFRYHSYGTLKRGGVKFGEYLEGDYLSDDLKLKIKETFGDWVVFRYARSQYAPEARARPMIVLLSVKAHKQLYAK